MESECWQISNGGVVGAWRKELLLPIVIIFLLLSANGVEGGEVAVRDENRYVSISVKEFGARGDGMVDDSRAIQAAIDKGREIGREIGAKIKVKLQGIHRCDAPIKIKSGVVLDGSAGSLKAMAPMLDFVEIESDAKLINTLVDANRMVGRFTIHTADFVDVEIINNEVINWNYGIVAENIVGRVSSDLIISGNKIHSPSDASIYPLWVNAKAVGVIRHVEVKGNLVRGAGGAYSPVTRATADQIELHGIVNSTVSDNISADGGEIGLVVARYSQNVLVANNVVSGADKDGIEIGSGAVKLTVQSTGAWKAGSRLSGELSGASGVIELIDGKNVYLMGVSGTYRVGEDVSSGKDTHVIASVQRTSDIVLVGNMLCNNGLDAAKSKHTFAGIKLIQADNVLLKENVVKDTNMESTSKFGVYVAQVSNIVNCSNSLTRHSRREWSLNGVSSFAPAAVRERLCRRSGLHPLKKARMCPD